MYSKYKYIINYILIILGIGIWQLIDWYFITEDPIGHILFYIFLIPLISLLYGIFIGGERNSFIMPVIAYLANLLMYIFMANGGFSFEIESLYISLIPFSSMFIGILIRKIPIWLFKKNMSKKEKNIDTPKIKC